uniref:Uncharacterized protein n=1 Tax=Ditylenchus dipsaci TaxID=166011 RepID=A0A915DUQ6_9BILA
MWSASRIIACSPLFAICFASCGNFRSLQVFVLLIPGPHHQSKLNLKNRTVLITGASTGVGRALAFEFYAKGAKVILTARSIDKLRELCNELEDMDDERAGKPSPAYVLINNAGVSNRGSCQQTSINVQRQVMEVNFFGQAAITKTLLESIPDDGAIVTVNSLQGRVALPYRSAYSASKHAQQAFFDSLRSEERPQLQVLVVNAGYINTGFGSRALDIHGRPVGVEDTNQLKGLSAEAAAHKIVCALVNRNTRFLLC